MSLKLKTQNPLSYVRAVSGLFINSQHPKGLTTLEIKIIALIMTYSKVGILSQSVRKQIKEELDLKDQNMSNIMTVLRKKGVLINRELHRIFTSKSVIITNANNN